jgi:hypothetical protein
MKQHRLIEGKIKYITVSRNPSGQYFACICVERVIEKLLSKSLVAVSFVLLTCFVTKLSLGK